MSIFLSRYRGILIALIGTTAWATTAIFISHLLDNYNLRPLSLAFWRDLFVGVILFILVALGQPSALRLTRRDVPFFVVYGFFGLAVFNSLWTYSVKFNGAAVATVLAYSSPAFTVLLARPVLKEPLTSRKLIAVALSLAGCVLVAEAYSVEQWQLNPIGILVGLGTGLAFAFFNLAGRWSAGRFKSSWTVTTYGFLFAALGLSLTQRIDLPANPAQSTGIFFANPAFSMGSAWNGWVVLGLLTIPTVLGYGLYTLSLRYLQASVAGLIATLEPALTAIMAIFILDEWLIEMQWLGAGLILVAVLLVQGESTQSQTSNDPREVSVV